MRGEPDATGAVTKTSESRNPFSAPGFGSWWVASMLAGTGVGIQSVTVPLFMGSVRSLD